MESEFIPRTIPRVRIALYGPSGVGKTLFLRTLLKGDTSDPEPTKEAYVSEILWEYKRVTSMGTVESVEKYKLTLIDVPGKDDYKESRQKVLQKVIGWIFMYDSTDPSSVDKLFDMIKNELASERKLKSAIGVIVVGTKSDLGINAKAIQKAEEVVKYLNENTMASLYGYKIPHIQISCKNIEQVKLTYLCLESIIFDLKPSDIILKKLTTITKSVAKPLEKIAPTKEMPIIEEKPVSKAETIKPAIKESLPEKPPVQEKMELKIKETMVKPQQKPEKIIKEVKKPLSTVPAPKRELVELKEQIVKPPKVETKPKEKVSEQIQIEVPKPKEAALEREKIRESIQKLIQATRKPKAERKVEKKIVAEKPTIVEIPRIVASKNKELLRLVSSVMEKVNLIREAYILEKTEGNVWSVAYDIANIILDDKKIDMFTKILSLRETINPQGLNSYLLLLKDSLMLVLDEQEKLLILRLDSNNFIEALGLLLAKEESGDRKTKLEGQSDITSSKEVSAKLILDDNPENWRLARKIKWISDSVEATIIVRSQGGKIYIAHDGGQYISDYHVSIIHIFERIVKDFAKEKPTLFLGVGRRSLLIIFGETLEKAIIYVFEKRPSLDVLATILSTAS